MPLKRWEKVCAMLGAGLALAGLAARMQPDPHRSERIIVAGPCRVPATHLTPPAPRGAAIVWHGLSANRGVMITLGRALAGRGLATYVVDLPGHGDNVELYSPARAELCSAALLAELTRNKEVDLARTILVGHSLGGDIAIRLADRFNARATIAISPGPLMPVPPFPDHLRIYGLPQKFSGNLLLFAGDMDLPGFRRGAEYLLRWGGGEQIQEGDFEAGRARQLRIVRWGTHTGQLFSRPVSQGIAQWIDQALGDTWAYQLKPRRMLLLLPLGIVLLFPAAARAAATLTPRHVRHHEEPHGPLSFPAILLVWLAAAWLAAMIAVYASLVFLTGATATQMALHLALTGTSALTLLWAYGARIRIEAKPALASEDAAISGARLRSATTQSLLAQAGQGFLLGLGLILTLGWVVSGEWGDLWMNGARWELFLFWLLPLFPYFAAEELMLSPLAGDKRAAVTRWTCFLLLRLLMWLPLVVLALSGMSQQALIVVMGLVFLLFSVVQRWAADAVQRRCESIIAAALFSTLQAAWFIAAVFPLM